MYPWGAHVPTPMCSLALQCAPILASVIQTLRPAPAGNAVKQVVCAPLMLARDLAH